MQLSLSNLFSALLLHRGPELNGVKPVDQTILINKKDMKALTMKFEIEHNSNMQVLHYILNIA